MIRNKYSKNSNFISFIAMFFVPLFFHFFNYFQNGFLLHDSLGYYQRFKYLVDYLEEFKNFPFWVDQFFYGTNSLFLFIKIGFIGTAFAIIVSILKINTYIAFIFLLSLYSFIIIYGIYLNLKKLKNINIIIIFLSVLFASSSSNLIAYDFDNMFIISIPYIFYWINKFFDNYKIINLSKVFLIIFAQHLLFASYTLVPIIYISIFIFLINLLFKGIDFKKIFKINAYKDYGILFISIGLFIVLAWFISFQYYQYDFSFDALEQKRNKDLSVDFNHFRTFAKVPLDNLLFTFFTNSFTWFQGLKNFTKDFVFGYSFAGVISIFYFLFKFKFFLKQNVFRIILSFIILLFVISSLNIKIVDYAFFSLPKMDIYRHLSYILNLGKPILLIFIGIILSDMLETKNIKILKKSIIISAFLYFAFIITIFILEKFSLEIKNTFDLGYDKEIFSKTSKILLSLNFLLILFIYLATFKNKYFFLKGAVIFFTIVTIYSFNIKPLTINKDKIKNYKETFIQNKVNFNKKDECIGAAIFFKKYQDYFELASPLWTATYGTFYLVIPDWPCKPVARWVLRETKHDPDTYQYKNITFSKNFILEKINNNKYFIKSSAQNISGLLKISYNKNWKITSDGKIINGVIDKGGFIYIDHKNKSSKELFLEFKDINLKIFVYVQLLSGFGFFVLLFFGLKKKFN